MRCSGRTGPATWSPGQGTMDRRERNTEHGAVVIAALRETGMSWRDVEVATRIPRTTAQRWAEPPDRAAPEE